MDERNSITRLTTREKEVLRAWLGHRTAKEIAIDLGISHHAVEKRLKMARTKLGAGSSLEAARMLAGVEGEAEGYQPTVTGPPDLPPAPRPQPTRRYRPIILGGIAMSFAIILALALAPAQPPAIDAKAVKPVETIEIDGNLEPIFDELDVDRNGFLENPESPFVTLAFLNPDQPGEGPRTAVLGDGSDPAQITEFYTTADMDSDNRVSFREYYVWSRGQLRALGIDTSMVLKIIPEPGNAEVVFTPDFEQLDEDRSGFLEGNEAPQLVRWSGNPTLNRNNKGEQEFVADRVTIAPLSNSADFYKAADSDGDGKVSRREFEAWATASANL